MIDFKDVTFIIPIKFDSDDRKNNFKRTINYLLRNFDTNIIVAESDKNSNEEFVKSVSNKIQYIFEKNDTNIFHRTKLLNMMTKLSTTNIVVNYDIDVIFKVEQYLESKERILQGFDFCFPYSGKFYDIKKEFFNYIDSDQLDSINLNQCTLFNPNSVGGALFFDKLKYNQIGLENEKFISWGHEDWERVVRIQKMGHRLCRVEGNLYHLTHYRDHNSSGQNPYYHQNGDEFNKIKGMDKIQLEEYIKTWQWI
jgi:predicted glycosyltransferase involved in capsule biosynthesis